jgi:hypothetical protein
MDSSIDMICADGAVNTNVNCSRICSLINKETDLYQAEKKLLGRLWSFRYQKIASILWNRMCGCGIWSVTLREVMWLRLFENKLLRKGVGRKCGGGSASMLRKNARGAKKTCNPYQRLFE